MAMYRIKCTSCHWKTKPHYSIIDCIKEKEWEHHFGIIKDIDHRDAHKAAFSDYCPKCGGKTIEQYNYFDI